jgi:hypothetical protein
VIGVVVVVVLELLVVVVVGRRRKRGGGGGGVACCGADDYLSVHYCPSACRPLGRDGVQEVAVALSNDEGDGGRGRQAASPSSNDPRGKENEHHERPTLVSYYPVPLETPRYLPGHYPVPEVTPRYARFERNDEDWPPTDRYVACCLALTMSSACLLRS